MMTKSPRILILALIAGAALATALTAAQENPYAPIPGTYEFDAGGRTLTFKVVLKDSRLYFDALIPEQEPQVMSLVEGRGLTFSCVDPNGNDMILAFDKDGQGRVPSCTITLPARNIEVKAVKIEKK